jgi:hypothetical protein
VRRCVREGSVRGVGVEFTNLLRAEREALDQFIEDAIPSRLADELQLVEDNDPRLA